MIMKRHRLNLIVLFGIILIPGALALSVWFVWRVEHVTGQKPATANATTKQTKTVMGQPNTTPVQTISPTKYALVSHAELIACAKQMGAIFIGQEPTTPEAAQQGVLRCTLKTGGSSFTDVYSTAFPNITAVSGSVHLASWDQLDSGLRQAVQARWSSNISPSACITTAHSAATVTVDGKFASVPTCIDGGMTAYFWAQTSSGWVNIGPSGQLGNSCTPFVDYKMPLQVGGRLTGTHQTASFCFDDNGVQRFISTSP